MDPILSIVIPTFNRSAQAAKQLTNIDRQLRESSIRKEVEVVVLDNCSDEANRGVIAELASKLGIAIKSNSSNIGLAGNYRRAFEVATGLFVWTLGDDDIVTSEAVRNTLQTINQCSSGTNLILHNHSVINGQDGSEVQAQVYSISHTERTLDSTLLSMYFHFYDFHAMLWLSGSVLRRTAALSALNDLNLKKNLALPLAMCTLLAWKSSWQLTSQINTKMIINTTSWAETYQKRLFGYDIPIALAQLIKLGVPVHNYEILSNLVAQSRIFKLKDLKQRRIASLRDGYALLAETMG